MGENEGESVEEGEIVRREEKGGIKNRERELKHINVGRIIGIRERANRVEILCIGGMEGEGEIKVEEGV